MSTIFFCFKLMCAVGMRSDLNACCSVVQPFTMILLFHHGSTQVSQLSFHLCMSYQGGAVAHPAGIFSDFCWCCLWSVLDTSKADAPPYIRCQPQSFHSDTAVFALFLVLLPIYVWFLSLLSKLFFLLVSTQILYLQ